LARAGVHPKLTQSLDRHSDINLTMSRFTHTTRGEQREVLAALRELTRQEIPAARPCIGGGLIDPPSTAGKSVAVCVARASVNFSCIP